MNVRTLALALAMLAVSLPAGAQEAPEGRGSAVLSYAISAVDGVDPWSGLQLEADWQPVDGSWFSLVAHVHSGEAVGFAGVGPRATWDLGPVSIFGHVLTGAAHYGGIPTDGLDAKGGGGVEIPVRGRWVIRLGLDYDGDVGYSSVGVGVRF